MNLLYAGQDPIRLFVNFPVMMASTRYRVEISQVKVSDGSSLRVFNSPLDPNRIQSTTQVVHGASAHDSFLVSGPSFLTLKYVKE